VTRSIGVLGTGDMGSAVGDVLRRAGFQVVTALKGRSAESRRLARRAGFEDLGSLEAVFAGCDLFLSILPPAAALDFARRAADIVRVGRLSIVYADCNAVAPATVRAIEALFDGGPAHFVDAGIVGPAPKPGTPSPTRLYVAGSERRPLLDLVVPEIDVIDMGESIGRASAIKMCYAAMNKGTYALYTNVLLAARRLGVGGELMREFESSQPEAARVMARRIPFLGATAKRFTGEMREIADTFDAAGVSGDFHRGAEWLYALLARSALGGETRSMQPDERSLDEALEAFAAVLGD
jgi:3-hydroxyisobutyrate dehydrogenase-like beta-hydroxyacid dehydrogenase